MPATAADRTPQMLLLERSQQQLCPRHQHAALEQTGSCGWQFCYGVSCGPVAHYTVPACCVHASAAVSEEESTLNLQALQEACPNAPWSLTVSYKSTAE